MRGPLTVIQIVEVAAQALVEDVGSAEGKGSIVAGGEASSVDCSGLGWAVELELVVGGDISCSSLGILQFAIGQSDYKTAWVTTSTLWMSVSKAPMQAEGSTYLVDITLHDLAVHSGDLEAPGVTC